MKKEEIDFRKCSVTECGYREKRGSRQGDFFNGQFVCPFHFERLTNPPVNALAIRIASIHGTLLKMGPKIGGPFVKFIAYYAMYRIFSSGGVEALAYVCYEHMLRTAEAEKKKADDKKRRNTKPV